LIGLLAWFLLKKRKSKQHAFDEKTVSCSSLVLGDNTANSQFDPRHSTHDPLDLLAPSVPDMGSGAAAGHVGGNTAATDVDPFPYDPSAGHGGNSYAYDPYSGQQSMEMPDARNYAPGAGGYPSYGGGDGGYGVAAALGAGAAGVGAAGYGAGRGYQAQSNTDYSHYSTSDGGHAAPTSPPMTAAQAKQREAANERTRNRMSPQYGNYGAQPYGYGEAGGSGGSPEEQDPANRRQSQAMSEGRSTVYQHTDYGSAHDGTEEVVDPPAEIPPK
jgi:hypothetical protein